MNNEIRDERRNIDKKREKRDNEHDIAYGGQDISKPTRAKTQKQEENKQK